jgi:hypothetical protein
MQWVIIQNQSDFIVPGSPIYWKERNAEDGIGASGEWVAGQKNATKYSDEARLAYIMSKGALPDAFKWKCVSQRFKNAIDIQSAVNPAGIALALHEAFCEVIAEGGDTKAQKTDPACRLIAYQIGWLLYGGVGNYTNYTADFQACAAIVEEIEKDSK